MAGPSNPSEWHRLLSAWCDGSVSDAEVERLDALVRSDPGFRAFYLAYMDQHALLAADVLPALGVPAPGPAGAGVFPFRGRRPWAAGRGWWAAAAAAVAAAGGLALLWPKASREPPVASRPSPPPAAATVLDSLAMVVKLDGVRWEAADGPPPAVGDVLKPRRLRLTAGVATLAFFAGATLTVEGPADVDLTGADRVFCRRGRLRARIAEGSRAFVVLSRESAVVDRGTEFGFNVGPDGPSHLMVFAGAAEAALLDKEGAVRRAQLVARSKEVELDPRAGRITEGAARAEDFLDAPGLAVPPLELDPGYAGAVLRSRPKGYWRFESVAGGEVPNEVTGGPPLRVSGPVAVARSPGGNGSAVFEPGAPGQFLAADGPWELARESGHAVEVWTLAEDYRYVSLVGLYPPKSYNPPDQPDRVLHAFFVELTGGDHGTLHKPGSVRFLHRWPTDIRVQTNLFSDRYYTPRRWHHVVAQKRGDRMEMFFDGARDRVTAIDPDYPTLPCHLVVGRRTTEADPKDSRSFVGRLDELAVYDHTLSDEEVRDHFARGAPARRLE